MLLARRFRISKRREGRCPRALIVRRLYPNHVGTAWIVLVSFGAVGIVQIVTPAKFAPTEERFICEDCEYGSLAFNDVHTKNHTLVRVVEKMTETVVSTEERLRTVEGHLESVQVRLGRMELLLSKLLQKGIEDSLDEAITKRDIQAVVESGNAESNDQEASTNNQETTDK